MTAIDTTFANQESSDGADATHVPGAVSPFAPTDLFAASDVGAIHNEHMAAISSPFAESFALLSESELEAQTFDDLVAELEDEEFAEALEALTNEAAARHLGAVATWRGSSDGPMLARNEVEQWMDGILAEAERILDEMETEYSGPTLEWFVDEELDEEDDFSEAPLDAQEFFFKSLKRKFKKVVRGVGNVVKKGVKLIGKLNPIARVIAALRKAVRPLLRRLLRRAIGKLPAPLRPVAQRLARRLGIRMEAGESLTEAEAFDLEVAEYLLAPEDAYSGEAEAFAEESVPEQAIEDLDAARARLARELAELPDGATPLAEMEQFIPAVMAAKPLIKLGISVIGRKRVVNALAKVMAAFISKLVGRQAGRMLSRHLADKGLRILGFEAEADFDDTIGMEALVAAAEETIDEIVALDPAAFEDEHLLEAEIQEAFSEAAVRHLPAEVLRQEVVEALADNERGLWVMMPRATSPAYRYKKYSRVLPLRITRPLARSVVMSGGETLERRLLDSGAEVFPVEAEMELFELMPGAELGHVAAFEDADGTVDVDEFEELTEEAAALLAGDGQLARRRRYAPQGGRAGVRRFYRLKVPGRRLRKKSRFSVRLDLSTPRPEIRVHLRLSERDAHRMAQLLDRRQTVQVVAAVRGLIDPAFQNALGTRLRRMVARRNIATSEGASDRLAAALSAAIVRAVSRDMPAAAADLAGAAKDPRQGATLTFAFPFADKPSIAAAKPEAPSVRIRPGHRRD